MLIKAILTQQCAKYSLLSIGYFQSPFITLSPHSINVSLLIVFKLNTLVSMEYSSNGMIIQCSESFGVDIGMYAHNICVCSTAKAQHSNSTIVNLTIFASFRHMLFQYAQLLLLKLRLLFCYKLCILVTLAPVISCLNSDIFFFSFYCVLYMYMHIFLCLQGKYFTFVCVIR